MRSPPADLAPERVETAVADGWQLRAASLEYLPEGGSSHHWVLADGVGLRHFVTVDDLDGKDWLGNTRPTVFAGLRRALRTATELRHAAGLEFVVAPVAARDGELLHRLGDRYSVSVFPFLAGRSYPFGPYPDERLRGQALDLIAALHRSTAVVRGRAPVHVLGFTDRGGLEAFLLDPGHPWDGGPFSESAGRLMASRAADIARLTAGFDRLTRHTAPARAEVVITHGEPHPANLMSVGSSLALIDWDTTALAPPERDVSLIITGTEGADRYQEATGRALDPAVLTLYRARWYLDDLGSAVRMFRHPHRDTADTRHRWHDLARQLEQLPRWLDLLA